MSSSHSYKYVPGRFDFKVGDYVADGKYRVEKHLGDGSFGEVYKVSDLNGQVWAMKLLRLWDVPSDIRQPLVDRFEMEFKTGRVPSHNLVHSVDYGFINGNPFIVMEFCPNGDLSGLLGKTGIDAPKYARDILYGLRDLHNSGKVHRDLKPENVLLKQDGTATLTDFGISGDRNKRMTERNIFGKPYQVFGTYAYMPPEQVNRARGESTVLPTTDVFSFGVVVYQLLTGILPFGKLEDQNDLVYYQKKGKAGEWDRLSLQRIPHGEEWMQLIGGCLKPDLKDRIQNADQALHYVPKYTGVSIVRKEPTVIRKKETDRFCLRITQGEEFGKCFDLNAILSNGPRRMVTVGRLESNDIQLKEFNDLYISRRHCTLERCDSLDWVIKDGQWNSETRQWGQSSNGTYVNSTQIKQIGYHLMDGDIISIGDVKLKFESK